MVAAAVLEAVAEGEDVGEVEVLVVAVVAAGLLPARAASRRRSRRGGGRRPTRARGPTIIGGTKGRRRWPGVASLVEGAQQQRFWSARYAKYHFWDQVDQRHLVSNAVLRADMIKSLQQRQRRKRKVAIALDKTAESRRDRSSTSTTRTSRMFAIGTYCTTCFPFTFYVSLVPS